MEMKYLKMCCLFVCFFIVSSAKAQSQPTVCLSSSKLSNTHESEKFITKNRATFIKKIHKAGFKVKVYNFLKFHEGLDSSWSPQDHETDTIDYNHAKEVLKKLNLCSQIWFVDEGEALKKVNRYPVESYQELLNELSMPIIWYSQKTKRAIYSDLLKKMLHKTSLYILQKTTVKHFAIFSYSTHNGLTLDEKGYEFKSHHRDEERWFPVGDILSSALINTKVFNEDVTFFNFNEKGTISAKNTFNGIDFSVFGKTLLTGQTIKSLYKDLSSFTPTLLTKENDFIAGFIQKNNRTVYLDGGEERYITPHTSFEDLYLAHVACALEEISRRPVNCQNLIQYP